MRRKSFEDDEKRNETNRRIGAGERRENFRSQKKLKKSKKKKKKNDAFA